MDHEMTWQRVADRLRGSPALTVTQFEAGAASESDMGVITLLGKQPPPPPIRDFYTHTNGVKLLWNGTLGGREIHGSVNILSLMMSSLRAPAEESGEPLEGILWNDEFPPAALKQLKRMAIFEHLAGRSAFLTYLVGEADAKLFLVDNDDIQPIIPDFNTTIGLLMQYAGADGVREHLTHADWRARLDADAVLQRIAAL